MFSGNRMTRAEDFVQFINLIMSTPGAALMIVG